MSRDVERSIERGRTSAVTAAKAIGEHAASVLPGGGLLFKLGVAVTEQTLCAIKDRANSRAEDRVARLFKAIQEEDDLRGSLSPEELDRLANADPVGVLNDLLAYAIQDEEEAKTRYYGRFYRALLRNDVPTQLRVRFLRNLRQLSCEAIELLREAVWYSRAHIGDPNTLRNYNRTASNERAVVVQELVNLGLFDGKDGTKPPQVSQYGETFAGCLFPIPANA